MESPAVSRTDFIILLGKGPQASVFLPRKNTRGVSQPANQPPARTKKEGGKKGGDPSQRPSGGTSGRCGGTYTLIPLGPSATAVVRVRWCSPALLALYA